MRPTLSLVVLVKDEWAMLERLMRRTRRFVDESLWVLGAPPGPRGLALARRLGAKICLSRRHSFSARLNDGIAAATKEWVLRLDVDELISVRDLEAMRGLLRRSRAARAFWLRRRSYSNTQNLWYDWRPNRGEYPLEERMSASAGSWEVWMIRLFRRSPEFHYVYRVHEDLWPVVQGQRFPRARSVIHHFQFARGDEADLVRVRRKAMWYARLALKDMRENKEQPRPLLARAMELLQAGAPSKGMVPLLRRALSRVPILRAQKAKNSLTIKAMLAISRLLDGDPQEACRSLAAPAGRKIPLYMLVAGTAAGCAGRWDESARWFRHVLRRNPDHPLALNGLGLALQASGRKKEALRAYQRAVRSNPHFQEARVNLNALASNGGTQF